MRVFALLLVSLSARAAIAPDTFAQQYVFTGLNSFNITATGSNLAAVCVFWSDSTITSATFGGNAMSFVVSNAVTHGLGGTVFIYEITAVTAGVNVVAVTSPGQTIVGCLTLTGAKQTAQPDATGAYISGVQDSGTEAAMPITTVANGSMVIGVYVSNVTLLVSPSSNGTFVGRDDYGAWYMWRSTSPVTPAGAFTLQARGTVVGAAYEAIGVSMAPAASSVIVANPSVSPIAVGP